MAGTPTGSSSPAKPWERAGTAARASGPSPFAPPSTSNSGMATGAVTGGRSEDLKDDENSRIASNSEGLTVGRPMPARPWEQSRLGYGTGAVGSYGQGLQSTGYGGYGGNYGLGSYGSSFMRNGMYGGSSMYGSSYGGGMYGSSYGGGYGMGGGMYGNRYGGGYGGYGMGGIGNDYQNGFGESNFPPGEPPPPPGFWQSLLKGLTDVMHFFGRLAMLVDENTQAFHFFITALLQLCDRAGVLYGELARFVLRILGFRSRSKSKTESGRVLGSLEPAQLPYDQKRNEGPPREPGWDNVWTKGDDS